MSATLLLTCAMNGQLPHLVNQTAALAPADGIGRTCPVHSQSRMDLRGRSLASEMTERAAVDEHAVDCSGTISDLIAASTCGYPTKRGSVQESQNCWCV